MALDGKILKAARQRLEQKKADRAAVFQRRRSEVYRKNPRVREIDLQLRGNIADVIGLALSRGEDPRQAVCDVRDDNLELQRERIEEIQAAGFPANYLDDSPQCPKCGDTGMDGTEICTCLMELYREEQRRELSEMLDIGSDSFDTFNLELYDDQPDPKSGVSPRENMDVIYETCVRYADRFKTTRTNLLLSGGTGLGKTFLSTCIAKAVSERGFSVVYDTAVGIFSKMEERKFSNRENEPEKEKAVQRLYQCDLLIIDDLGTEMMTSFTVSALYDLINSRLISGKRTVINTNLTLPEIRKRYPAPIASRLEGEYRLLVFHGKDLRLRRP